MEKTVRSVLMLTSVVLGATLLATSCKNSGAGTGPDGGPAVKLICKMNQQCWICPSEDAMKKCIINPVTSGCKMGSPGDCS